MLNKLHNSYNSSNWLTNSTSIQNKSTYLIYFILSDAKDNIEQPMNLNAQSKNYQDPNNSPKLNSTSLQIKGK